MTDELQHKLDEATQEARQLRKAFEDYQRLSREDRKRVDRVEQKASRQTTWLALGILVVLVFVGSLILWNRVTLQQAQREAQADLTFQIVNCFLRPGSNTPAQVEECTRRNGGPLYAQRQKESAEAVKRFVDLQEWAQEQGWKPPPTPEE